MVLEARMRFEFVGSGLVHHLWLYATIAAQAWVVHLPSTTVSLQEPHANEQHTVHRSPRQLVG